MFSGCVVSPTDAYDVGGCSHKPAGTEPCFFANSPLLSCLRNRKSCFGDDVTYSVGEALRHRHMYEENRLRPGVPAGGARTTYNLWRFAPFASISWNESVTGFWQAIDSSAFGYDASLTPVEIDINRSDLLRYYAEINLGDVVGATLKYRYGRQFLKYESQYVLSNLGRGNTFRNFEDHKLLWNSGEWAINAFSMANVNAVSGGSGFGTTSFDTVDSDRQIHGMYISWSGIDRNKIDLYWLWRDEYNHAINRQDGSRHSFGARLADSKPVRECRNLVGTWNWNIEVALQVGEDNFTVTAPSGTN